MATATTRFFWSTGSKETSRSGVVKLDGKAVAGPRSEFDGVLARRNQEIRCVFLTGTDPIGNRQYTSAKRKTSAIASNRTLTKISEIRSSISSAQTRTDQSFTSGVWKEESS